jgi:hypothetical protein
LPGEADAAVYGLVVSLVTLLLSIWMRQRKRTRMSPDDLEPAASWLTKKVKSQWLLEANTRGLLDPLVPLAVRWRSASPALTDHPDNVRGALSGSSADVDSLAAMFSGLPHRRLVILGAPGSGKTSLAVLLLLALIEHRAPGDPVPVLMSASTWDPDEDHMDEWLVRELERVLYGTPQRRTVSAVRSLLDSGKLLPIIDGLDELHKSRRPKAIAAVNRALRPDSSVIMTCRVSEYEEAVQAGDVLTAAAAVIAESIDPHEVVEYLTLAIPPHRLPDWQPFFTELTGTRNEVLEEVFSTALNIALARSVYSVPGSTPAELADTTRFPAADDVQRYLLDELVRIAFPAEPVPAKEPDPPGRRPRFWSPRRAPRWLGFLASNLERFGTPDLAWWRLRDALPPTGIAVAFGIFGGLIFGVAGALRYGDGYEFGIAGALATGLAASFRKTPEPRYQELRGFAFARSGARLLGRIGCIALPCLLAGGELLGVACGGFGAAIVFLLQYSWVPVKADHANGPFGLLRLHRTVFLRNLLGGVAGGLAVGLIAGAALGHGDSVIIGVITGTLGGLAVGMAAANAWIGYRIAHLWLAVQGKIPWRLITFLDDSYKRGLLRQSGAAYQFRHDHLQRRLAEARREG